MSGGVLDTFQPATREWFGLSFAAPTRAQQLAWPVIARGESALLLAPTGSGKTLAAFLAAIDRLLFEPVPPKGKRCRIVYISPLKALAVDVERNLRAPLAGVARAAERAGLPFHEARVAIRTGDTPHRDRAEFLRDPADILITTPESLYLLLTSQAREGLRTVDTVIVDEVHAMVATKRGSHLALSLERLELLAAKPLQRIGLSATQRPLEEIARFLGGTPDGTPRPVTILDAGERKRLDLRVEVPVEDMARLGEVVDVPSGPAEQGEVRTSIWASIHPLILKLIRAHRSTLIFCNSRRLAERLANGLNELAGKTIVHAHHGSIAREQRQLIEDLLKSGKLPALVATSTLELGIDMGAIDLVIQVETPPSVASGMQRIGRAGHTIDAASTGVILPKYRGDLLACAALTERMLAGQVEHMHYVRNPLDVLAQQIVAMVAVDDWPVDELARVIHRAAPFSDLTRGVFEAVLDMLSGRYPGDELAELRPRVVWDRLAGVLTAREGSKRVAIMNGGTIPDRGLYGVFLAGAERGTGRVGELDEEMVFETRVGDVFLLGASSWRVQEITHDRVLVSPAPGVPGKMPFWHGENPGRPLEFGRAIGSLVRTLRAESAAAGEARLVEQHKLTENAARNLLRYLRDQETAIGTVPDDRTIVIERYVDELGDWRVCILSHFGGRVHAPWAMAIGALVRERTGHDTDILYTDDGIVVRFPEAAEPPPVELLIPEPEDAQDLVMRQLGMGGGGARQEAIGAPVNALFASHFREAAQRALLLPRRFPGQRAPLWQQRKRAADLLEAAAKYGSFPIVLETYRECLQDVFEMPAFDEILRAIRDRAIRVVTVDTRTPSPFASSLLFNYVANFIYEGDAPLAERRAQALLVDPAQLRELLGEVELRELLDADALAELELQLQHLTPERAAKHVDGVHDMLLRLGDLTPLDILARSSDPASAPAWITSLDRDRRIVALRIGGEERYVAVEDVARYRDALGVPLPHGLPTALLSAVRDPIGDLVARYARTHGPFRAIDAARRFGVGEAVVRDGLHVLGATGRVVEGAFRPGGTGTEWADAGVLRTLRQRSLARLRHEVEPVEQPALARFATTWHALDVPRRGPRALFETIEQLSGVALPASELEAMLRARVADYGSHDLDALTASGSVVWVGRGSSGSRDGRVSLYPTAHAMLIEPPGERPDGELHQRIRAHLAERGASFFPTLVAASGAGFVPDVLEALWDLVWAGEVTNDTLAPLRSYLRPSRSRASSGRRAPALDLTHARGSAAVQAPAREADGRSVTARPSRPVDTPPEAAGRWSLVSSNATDASPTERLHARVRQLLDRHGVLTREAVQAEELPGGFTSVYGVLKAMEDAGRVRRGHFVAGRGATQFALPIAVERLRGVREPAAEPVVTQLAATDPANPYGAALPWPERSEVARRPMRGAAASVILVDGALAAWVAKGERDLLTFDPPIERDPELVRDLVARQLAALVQARFFDSRSPSVRRKLLFIETVDGVDARGSRMAEALRAHGFIDTARGFLRRPLG
ncbi:MAG TPA: DEAD/DEAH box helicase [Candidatus Limnocylindria bacterium]|nr:DEAD/DEAH box helicase [Candidatus Limnocylindria bacterium]